MAITYPLDLLTNFPGWTVDFELTYRQELSRHASGVTRAKDFGQPIWRGTWSSRQMKPNELDHWRARMTALEGALKTFTAWKSSRCRPIAHPGNSALPSGTVHAIGEDNKSVRINGLTGITLSVGDMIQINGNLHEVMEQAVAVAGLTPLFEIRPHLWPGTAVADAAIISKPSCIMTLDLGSLSSRADPRTGMGIITFSGIEAR